MKQDEKLTISPKTEWLPTIAMRGLVAFPGMVMHFDIAREPSVKAIDAAHSGMCSPRSQDRRMYIRSA